MLVDPLKYVKIEADTTPGKYIIERVEDPMSLRLIDIISSVLAGYKSLSSFDLSFLGERSEDFVIVIRDFVKHLTPKKLYHPEELLYYAEELYKALKVIGIESEYVSIKSVYDGLGLGDLEFAIYDPDLEEIVVNGTTSTVYVYHKRYGFLETNMTINTLSIERRLLSQKKPKDYFIDGRLPDGSRFNLARHPVSDGGDSLTIRKFRRENLTMIDILNNGTLTVELLAYLWLAVEGMGMPSNIIIAGNTGSGKTTTLNTLIDFVPISERIVTIEDTRELSLYHPNWVALYNSEGDVEMEEMLINALRMRPDRIIVGEVRGREAETLLAAMNVGHPSMGTLHANSARDVLRRLTTPPMDVPQEMLSVIDIIVVQHRIKYRGRSIRRIVQVVETEKIEEGIGFFEAFRWDPATDSIVMNNSYPLLFERIAEFLNTNKREVAKEFERRKRILEDVVRNNLTRKQYIALINSYYIERGM